LFSKSLENVPETTSQAIECAQNLKADLGQTDILTPLEELFSVPPRDGNRRQVFVLTNGEVDNPDEVIQAVTRNRAHNICCSLGIGSGADAGLVEGIARAGGGRSDFVLKPGEIMWKVMAQLGCAVSKSMDGIEIHIEGINNFETVPSPIPSVENKTPLTILLNTTKSNGEILVTGNLQGELIDLSPTEYRDSGVDDCLFALFAFENMKILQHGIGRITKDDKERKCVRLSIASGVLCRYTAFVGIDERATPERFRLPVKNMTGKIICLKVNSCTRVEDVKRMICDREGIHPDYQFLTASGSKQMMDGYTLGQCGIRPGDVVHLICRYRGGGEGRKQIDVSLEGLIGLLDPAGYWTDAGAIRKLLDPENSCEVDYVFRRFEKDMEDPKVCATVLAIAVLRRLLDSKRQLWIMVETKALEWLRKWGVDAKSLIEWTAGDVGSSWHSTCTAADREAS
jgi:hypothetical protein